MPVFLSFFPKNRHFEMGSNCDVLTLKRTSFSTFFVVGRSNHLPTTSAFFRQIPSVAIYTKKLESLHPAGHLVRRKSHNGGLCRVCRTQLFIVILHRNLAFFQTLCGAVLEYIGRRIEAVITGLTRNQLNSKEFRGFESHRLRQVSLLNSTLGSDFLLPFCKTPLLFL